MGQSKYAVKDTPQDQLAYALEFYEAEEYEKAVNELRKLIRHYPRAREAAEAQYYLALNYERLDRPMKAFRNYQTVLEKYPFSERTAQIVKRQYEIGNEILDGKYKRNKFVSAVVGGDYNVIEIFRTVIKNAPYGGHAAPAQYKIGLYLLQKRMYQEARDEFEKTINDYPDSEWVKAARYQIAVSDAKRSAGAEYNQSVTQAAIDEFKDFVKTNPDAELSDAAKAQIQDLREKEAENSFIVAQFYEKQKKDQAAKICYSEIVDQYKDTSWASKALEKIREISGRTP